MPDSSNDEFLQYFEPQPEEESPEYQHHQLMEVMPFFHGLRPIQFDEVFTSNMFVCTFYVSKNIGKNKWQKLAKIERFAKFNDGVLNTTFHWLGQPGAFWVCSMETFADSKNYYFPYVSISEPPPQFDDDHPPIILLDDVHPFASGYLASTQKEFKVEIGPRESSIGNINFSKPSPLP